MYAVVINGAVTSVVLDYAQIFWDDNTNQSAASLSAEQLTQFNLYPFVEIKPVPITSLQKYEGFTDVFDGTQLTRTYIIVAKTADEIAIIQQSIWLLIKAERDRRTQEGGYLASGKWFDSTLIARTQQIGLIIMGANIPPGIMWKTMDNSFIEMTQAVAGLIFSAAATQDTTNFAVAQTHLANAIASNDPMAYDFSAGWPQCYLDL